MSGSSTLELPAIRQLHLADDPGPDGGSSLGQDLSVQDWSFGDEILYNPYGPTVTTGAIAPTSLRLGRTYRFRARKVVRLHDTIHYIIDANGGGTANAGQEVSPGGSLGTDRSIVDTVSYEIVIRRVR